MSPRTDPPLTCDWDSVLQDLHRLRAEKCVLKTYHVGPDVVRIELCESTDAVETPESTVSVPEAKYVFAFESTAMPTLMIRTHDIKNLTVSRDLVDGSVTVTSTDQPSRESWEMMKAEQKDWLCCYELCVGGRAFYLHEIMGGFTPDEAASKMLSHEEGDGWSLQSKGVLGEATLPLFLHHFRSTVTAEIG